MRRLLSNLTIKLWVWGVEVRPNLRQKKRMFVLPPVRPRQSTSGIHEERFHLHCPTRTSLTHPRSLGENACFVCSRLYWHYADCSCLLVAIVMMNFGCSALVRFCLQIFVTITRRSGNFSERLSTLQSLRNKTFDSETA